MPPAERFDIEEMTQAPCLKSAQGVNRRLIWRCLYPDRGIPRCAPTHGGSGVALSSPSRVATFSNKPPFHFFTKYNVPTTGHESLSAV
jgi:hypothetical protein